MESVACAVKSLAPTAAVVAHPPPIAEDLARVEERLGEELVSRESRLATIASHLLGAGGKRVRPSVVLLAFHAAGDGARRHDDAIEAAVALELIHSATLLHDDIIDGGDVRRGRPSALRTFGVSDTLVAGDFLFSRAFALCARFEPAVIRWAADACVSLTEGEILQGRFRHNPSVTVADYLEIIRRKTASLFAAGARTAAHLAGASPELVEAMAAGGEHIGLAFQVSDDLLDVVGHPGTTGKPRGIDLRDGNPSLPIVLALRADPEFARLFASDRLAGSDVEAGLGRIRQSGVLAEVAARAQSHVSAALEALVRLPASPYRRALEALTQSLGERSA
ncbi:MAG: polyprenyl synthetase family protein [Deltaproteobacteria bacterium]|nr:MAG: polyprenyl synthetase family protein [Deltaproteobacteria bacterium]